MASNPSSKSQGGTRGRARIELAVWPTIVLFIGLFVLFVAERMVTKEGMQRGLDVVAVLLMLASAAGFAARRQGAQDALDKQAQGNQLLGAVTVLLGIAIYLVFASKVPGVATALKNALGAQLENANSVVTALWPALVVLGALPVLFIQQALYSMTDGDGRAESIEPQRIKNAWHSGISVSLVLVTVAALNYVAIERNTKLDFARFRSTRPSEATRKIVQNLSKSIQVTLFFPTTNEVREQVEPYFQELAKESSRFTVRVLDHAMEPTKARELSATDNGLVVMSQLDEKGASTQRENINLGQTIERAQNALTSLDGDVQKKLLALSRPGRIAYFTTGHGERAFDVASMADMQKDDMRAPVGFLRGLLNNLGYEVRTLSVAQGLGTKVPGDAGLVIVAGPTEHFLQEEVGALTNYLQEGGRVYLLMDPISEVATTDLAPLLQSVGLKYNAQLLAHDEVYAVRTNKAADKNNVVATSFSSHVSVTLLSRAAGRVGVILPKSGYLERSGATPAGIQLDFPMRTLPKTYVDTNSNFAFDQGEKQQVFDVAAVAQKTLGDAAASKDKKNQRELRLAVLASVDTVTDLGLLNRANGALVQDTVKWLMNDEALVGETAQEQDLPIMHTKDQDKVWFYSTIIAAPLLVLGLGFVYLRSVRRRRAS